MGTMMGTMFASRQVTKWIKKWMKADEGSVHTWEQGNEARARMPRTGEPSWHGLKSCGIRSVV